MRLFTVSCSVLALSLAVLSGGWARAQGGKADLYVAPNGNDAWTGTLAAPNRAKTNGPLATLDRARQHLRELKALSKHVGPWTVELRGGTYALPAPVVFTAEDGGTQDSPIVYEAAPGERVTLSGGTVLSGWTQARPGVWTTTLPDVQSGKWAFAQLWANEERRFRPRLPKRGFDFIAGSLSPSPRSEGKGYDRFKFYGEDISSGWSNLHDVEALCFQTWTMARLRVDTVDAASKTVNFTGNTRGLETYSGLPKGNRYILENVKEALTEPGEWYLDRPTGTLTYLARPGETAARTAIVAPRLEHLLQIEGTRDRPVEYLTFRGLTFAHSNWTAPADGNPSTQAEANLDAALTLQSARHCTFDGCEITHIGTYGIQLGEGCSYDTLENCLLTDLGAGGVKIGTMGISDDNARVARNNLVRNCIIAHGGRMHPAGIGVWIGQSPFNHIEHNLIADFYYSGLSVGWTWGYSRSLAHDNQILGNRVLQIGQGVLSDMGGIYTLGLSPGTLVEGNVFGDIHSFDYGGWGIYLDEGTTDLVARNNLVYNTKTGGFHQHYGKNNTVTNNIFAFSEQGQLIRTRQEDHLSFMLEHNIVLFAEGSLFGSNWADTKGFRLDNNLYWKIPAKEGGLSDPKAAKKIKDDVTFNGLSLSDWQKTGEDVHSLISDPLFVDPQHGDFHLKPGSPAAKIGFVPFDYTQAGPQLGNGDAKRSETTVRLAKEIVRLAEKPVPADRRAYPAPPPPPPPVAIVDNFEDDLNLSVK